MSPKDLEKIKESIQLSASSYGLQLFKVLIIENTSIREKLRPVSWRQSQITDASHLLVFCNYNDVTDKDVETSMQLRANVQATAVTSFKIKNASDFMKTKMKEKSARRETQLDGKADLYSAF